MGRNTVVYRTIEAEELAKEVIGYLGKDPISGISYPNFLRIFTKEKFQLQIIPENREPKTACVLMGKKLIMINRGFLNPDYPEDRKQLGAIVRHEIAHKVLKHFAKDLGLKKELVGAGLEELSRNNPEKYNEIIGDFERDASFDEILNILGDLEICNEFYSESDKKIFRDLKRSGETVHCLVTEDLAGLDWKNKTIEEMIDSTKNLLLEIQRTNSIPSRQKKLYTDWLEPHWKSYKFDANKSKSKLKFKLTDYSSVKDLINSGELGNVFGTQKTILSAIAGVYYKIKSVGAQEHQINYFLTQLATFISILSPVQTVAGVNLHSGQQQKTTLYNLQQFITNFLGSDEFKKFKDFLDKYATTPANKAYFIDVICNLLGKIDDGSGSDSGSGSGEGQSGNGNQNDSNDSDGGQQDQEGPNLDPAYVNMFNKIVRAFDKADIEDVLKARDDVERSGKL